MHANHRDEDEEPVMAMAMAHLLSQGLLVGQRRPIVRRHHLIWESLECITRYRVILLGAQNEADRWVLPVQHPVCSGVVQVQVHLPRVGVGELAKLQIDDDEAA